MAELDPWEPDNEVPNLPAVRDQREEQAANLRARTENPSDNVVAERNPLLNKTYIQELKYEVLPEDEFFEYYWNGLTAQEKEGVKGEILANGTQLLKKEERSRGSVRRC